MLDDRPYMREPSSGSRWTATMILIVANAVLFAAQLIAQSATPPHGVNRFEDYLALTQRHLAHGWIWQLVTFQFLHANLLHLILNCAMLYMFGRPVEDAVGQQRFLTLYLGSGVAGGLLQVSGGWLLPGHFGGGAVLGASAGVFGIIAAFAVLHWETPITTLVAFIIPVTMRAKYLVLVSVVLAVLGMLSRGSNIAHAAHLGGLLAGLFGTRWLAGLPLIKWPGGGSVRRRGTPPRRIHQPGGGSHPRQDFRPRHPQPDRAGKENPRTRPRENVPALAWLPLLMRLFEAIVDANHRAGAGDATAGLRPAEFADELPIVALSCIDARLNPLLPEVLGVPESHFIWLRNAGNLITGPLSSTLRSLALACAVKGGREIAIIGHTDCLVCKTSMMQLTDRLRALGIDRAKLPENLTEFFGLFASERQNVMKAVEFVRGSPLIGPRVPVHGLMVDIQSGRLEWVVNGYQALDTATSNAPPPMQSLGALPGLQLPEFKLGEMKFPEGSIGGDSADAQEWRTPPPALPVGAPTGLTMAEPEAEPPPIKRRFEPRLATIPLPKQGETPPKLKQPWKRPPQR